MEVVRTLDVVYLDQARHGFDEYVRRTLAASQAFGGRFNPRGEFGALYTASDEATAWAEIASRYRREGIPGLPTDMGVLRIVLNQGRFADFTDPENCTRWQLDKGALVGDDAASQELCWSTARAVRAIADFLRSPSAREDGANVPLFPDREGVDFPLTLVAAYRQSPPEHLRQESQEAW